jgi:hypothetical protein
MRIYTLVLLLIVVIGCTTHDVTLPKDTNHYTHIDIPSSISDSIIIDGYFNQFSFLQEDTVSIFLNAKKSAKSITLGIYDINKQLNDYLKCDVVPQKIANTDAYKSGFGYKTTCKYIVPSNLKSGLYFLGNIPFLVKNNSKIKAKIAIVHPSNTDIAYNNKGGMSYYYPSHQNRARVLSKERPWMFNENGNSINFYAWLSKLTYSFDFLSDEDMENYDKIKEYKALVFVGHSEYWTRNARLNFDKFINENHHALILSGNSMYWQVRYEAQAPLQQICYKYDAFPNDPIADIFLKTGRWEDYRINLNPILSIGVNYYTFGGFQNAAKVGFGGYKILKPQNELFKGLDFKYNDVMKFNADEYDGAKLSYVKNPSNASDIYPVYDNTTTNFYKVQLLAYDLAVPDWGGNDVHNGTLLVIRKKATSGFIINIGASNWCKEIDKLEIKKITTNAFDLLQKADSELDKLFL